VSLILIVTHSKDLGADFVIRHLRALGGAYLRLDTDKLGTSECFFGSNSEPELHVKGRLIRKSEVKAIWARRFALPEILAQVKPDYADFVKRELATVMDAFLEGAPEVFQINTSSADRIAGNRILQSQRAERIGFSVPDSLVTQNAEDAGAFLDRHAEAVCKALSFGRLSSTAGAELVAYTSVAPRDLPLDGLAQCPALFQQKVSKRFDWRITTVGDRAFSARATVDPESPYVDWREEDSGTQFEAAEPPPAIVEWLLQLARDSGIVYGAHDLIESEDGKFYFLETNPAGQWGWLELTLGLQIGRAIADTLMAHAKC
jgi:glutathione synthase/RimK-type ligase-like ATP-grasp enzyme